MKHQTRERLQTIADVHADVQRRALTRSERLARWIEVLEQTPDRCLNTLAETEFQPATARAAMRSAASPLTVAFEDPVLRADGLNDDTYGEAKRFFELSDWELHQLVCSVIRVQPCAPRRLPNVFAPWQSPGPVCFACC
jgi:hypothetical protein